MLDTLKKSASKLLLLAVLAPVLIGGATVVYANCLYFVGYTSDGGTIWLSCGSSAGAYVYTCDSSGACQQQPAYDGQAQQICAQMPPCN